MKSKGKKLNINKVVKAAFPIFALFGGNGFASNRNQSLSLNSKRAKQSAVIHISDKNTDSVKIDLQKEARTVHSPFAVFTLKTSNVKSSQVENTENTVDFLKSNGFLTASSNIQNKNTANLSGNIISQNKIFSHDLVNRNNLFGTLSSGASNQCTIASNSFKYMGGSISTISNCTFVDIFGGLTTYGYDLVECQNLHNQCMGGDPNHTHAINMPVELLKFDIE